ncbi:MAG: Asp23/Gls24 family envelope stress response protein [Bacillota bacterium]
MSKEWETEYGKVIVNKDVIAKIAGLAAMECYGLVGMSSRNMQDGIADLLGWDNLTKGIIVNIEDDEVSLELNIIVEYGTNIQQVAANAMERVNYTVNDKLGVKVAKVDINVQGVRVQDEDRQ